MFILEPLNFYIKHKRAVQVEAVTEVAIQFIFVSFFLVCDGAYVFGGSEGRE